MRKTTSSHLALSIGFATDMALSCLRAAFGAAARLQEDVLEVDSDRCIMTYMGKMKEGWYACYR